MGVVEKVWLNIEIAIIKVAEESIGYKKTQKSYMVTNME